MAAYKLFVAFSDMVGTNSSTAILESYFDDIVYPHTRDSAIDVLLEHGETVTAAIVGVKENISADVIRRLPNLRVLGTVSTGTDHLDLDCLSSADINVIKATGINGSAVAEHSLTMMLSLLKQSAISQTASLTGTDRAGLPSLPRELRHRNVSVFGAGHSASALIRFLQPFDCKIRVWTPHPEMHTDLHDYQVEFASVDDLIHHGEIVSIHLPLTDNTKGLISEARLRALPERAIVINTSRREIFNWDDLRVVLNDRTDITIGIDDFNLKNALEGFDTSRLIVSPHIAGITEDSIIQMENHVVTEIEAYVKETS